MTRNTQSAPAVTDTAVETKSDMDVQLPELPDTFVAPAQHALLQVETLTGYQRTLGDTLRENQTRGLSNSLLDMNTRQAMARGYAGDRAKYAAGLVGQSEAEKKQMLQLLLSLASGFGGQALGGYQQAASLQSNPMQDIMGAAAMAGKFFGGF